MRKGNRTITKSRLVGRNWGDGDDLLYRAISHQGYTFHTWTQEECLTYYRQSKEARTAQVAAVWPPAMGETITTTTGRKTSMNNCSHIKNQYVNYPFFLAHWDYRNKYVFLEPFYRFACYTGIWTDASRIAYVHSKSNDQMFSARAYWSMRPKLESSVSLINSIFELKDFADIASYMFSPNGAARVVAKNMNKLTPLFHDSKKIARAAAQRLKQQTLKNANNAVKTTKDWLTRPASVVADLTHAAATANLTYNLAIMPTVQDCMAIHAEAQKNVFEQLKQFKQFGDEGARSHFSENSIIENTVTPGSYNEHYQGTGKLIRIRRTATMVSYYELLWRNFEEMYPKWWGLEVGADEVWNMLPLSFVLDYVLTVGKSLEYMDVDNRIKVHRVEYCESVKVTAELGRFIIQTPRTPHLIVSGRYIAPTSKTNYHLVTGTCGSAYKRTVMEPYKGPALPKIKLPSIKQAGNMLSLARCLIN